MKTLQSILTIIFCSFLTVGLFAQKKDKKEKVPIKSYKKLITSNSVTDEGFFKIHKVDDKYYFEIPNDLLEREILIVTRLSGTGEGRGVAGTKARPQQVIRWELQEKQLLLRSVSYNSVASEENPIYESVRRNNFEPIVKTFDIRAYGANRKSIVIEVNDLFLTHVPLISAAPSYSGGYNSLDEERCFIKSMKSYPNNMEIKHVLTYRSPGNSSCLLYTSPSPRDATLSRMPSSA